VRKPTGSSRAAHATPDQLREERAAADAISSAAEALSSDIAHADSSSENWHKLVQPQLHAELAAAAAEAGKEPAAQPRPQAPESEMAEARIRELEARLARQQDDFRSMLAEEVDIRVALQTCGRPTQLLI